MIVKKTLELEFQTCIIHRLPWIDHSKSAFSNCDPVCEKGSYSLSKYPHWLIITPGPLHLQPYNYSCSYSYVRGVWLPNIRLVRTLLKSQVMHCQTCAIGKAISSLFADWVTITVHIVSCCLVKESSIVMPNIIGFLICI